MSIKARLVKVGNSRGIRIPKAIVEQCGLGEEVELTVQDNVLIVAPAHGLREGWDKAFRAMVKAGDDALLIPESVGTTWDEEEWDW